MNPQIKTFIFLDLESTGLPYLQRKIKMTELCAVAVSRRSLINPIPTDCIPRIHNKLSFVVNPFALIPDEVVEKTGLDNFMLEELRPVSQNIAKCLKNFIKACEEPACLVAHNGEKFDFRLLKEELKNFPGVIPDRTLCVDSLEAFRTISNSEENGEFGPLLNATDLLIMEAAMEAEKNFSVGKVLLEETLNVEFSANAIQQKNETTPEAQKIGHRSTANLRSTPETPVRGAKRKLFDSEPPKKVTKVNHSLSTIYRALFDEEIAGAHQAENDAMALLKCVVKIGSPMLEYFDRNAKFFVDVKSLY